MARARAGRRSPLPWAATIVLTLGVAGVAYAAPGSPLPRWIEAVGRSLGFGTERAPNASVNDRSLAGVAVAPGDSLVIRFAAAPAAIVGYARVELTDESQVVVASPASSTRFTTEPTVLLVEHRTGDTLRVGLPRSSRHVEIEVGGRTVLLLEEGSAPVTDVVADSAGAYLIPMVP
jgi:hypothetical protein